MAHTKLVAMKSILYLVASATSAAAEQPDSVSTLKAAVQAVNLMSNGLEKYIAETQKELVEAEKADKKQMEEITKMEDQKHRAEELKHMPHMPRVHLSKSDSKSQTTATEVVQSPTTKKSVNSSLKSPSSEPFLVLCIDLATRFSFCPLVRILLAFA